MRLTFKQFLLEYEFHIPKTTYGYWITDDGEFIAVDYQAHGAMLYAQNRVSKKDPGRRITSYHEAFKNGWVRVIDEPNMRGLARVWVEFEQLTPKSFYALRAFLFDRAEAYAEKHTSVYIDTGTYSDSSDNFKDIIRLVNKIWNEQK